MPDTREITATLVVGFGEANLGANDGLVVDVDDRPDGLNQGRTRFSPGDDVYILVYKTENVVLNTPVVSAGSLIPRPGLSPVFYEKEQDLQFVDELEATLQYPIPPGVLATGNWLGNSLGNVTQRGQLVVGIPAQAAAHWAGLYRHVHTAQADVYVLTNTYLPYESYSIICHFTGVAS